MTTASSAAPPIGTHLVLPRGHLVFYWVTTAFVAFNSATAGTLDVLRIQPFFGMLLHLGYPAYFSAILGTWKVLGALAIVVPGTPRLKEWAYAGLFFDCTSAALSYLATGAGLVQTLGPLLFAAVLVASWALRPPTRRLPTARR